MSTVGFIKKLKCRPSRKSKAPALQKCPQKRAIIIKSFETTPRKPNSARRKVAKVRLSNRRRLNVYLEGIGSNKLQPHSIILVRGRGPRDLPGVRYHAIRGLFDFFSLKTRAKGRSKYGTKKLEILLAQKKLLERRSFAQKRRFLQYKIHGNGRLREHIYY